MNVIEKTPDLLEELQSFELFRDIDPSALQWLIDSAEYYATEEGEYLVEPDIEVDYMNIILAGKISVLIPIDGDLKELDSWEAGHVTGILPFSRMKTSNAYAQMVESGRILNLHRRYFTEMVNVSYELTQALVGLMSNRIREYTQWRYQDEKLMALGRMSAGLAHELNNPSAAIVRQSEELYERVRYSPKRFKAVINVQLSGEQIDCVNDVLVAKIADKANQPHLSLLEEQEQLDELTDWLEDHDIEEAEEVAETLLSFAFTLDDLDNIYEKAEGKDLSPVFNWMENTLSLERLVSGIQESAGHISEMVTAVKQYSHMDRGSGGEQVDLPAGINSTLRMLSPKLKEKNIQVEKEFPDALPAIFGYPGELNQVWTNLIDNAIDAMEQDGKLKIEACRDRSFVWVEFTDNGSGIPEELQSKIFEPFFTTKPMGIGSGIGLDIVRRIIKERHNGDIRLESQVGRTVFKVCLPINA